MQLLKIKTAYFNLDHLLFADITSVHEKGVRLTLVFNSPLEARVGEVGKRENFKIEVMLNQEQVRTIKAILDAHLVVFTE